MASERDQILLELAELDYLCYRKEGTTRAGKPVHAGKKELLDMTDAPTPRRAGANRLVSSLVVRCAALAASIALGAGGAAYAQAPAETTETPSETMQAPTETTPTETTPTETTPTEPAPADTTPTETTPAPSPEPTAAPNEYVESVPTGGGQTPVSEAAPATPGGPAETSSGPVKNTADDAASLAPKANTKRRTRARARRRADHPAARPSAAPLVPTMPASADPGEPANPLLLGIALLLITGAAVGTAVARRDGAAA